MRVERRGVRVPWRDAPIEFVASLEARFGAKVVSARDHPDGFSPGTAAALTLDDGRTLFTKVIRSTPNPVSINIYRDEANVLEMLGTQVAAPRLLWRAEGAEADGALWFALVIEYVAGHHPRTPWDDRELRRVLDAIDELGSLPSHVQGGPYPDVRVAYAARFTNWRRLARAGSVPGWADPWLAAHLDTLAAIEQHWGDAAAGHRLVHGDLRSDNILLTEDGVYFLDWPYAAKGAAWVDLVLMLPSMMLEGGIDPEQIVAEHPLSRVAPPEAVTTVLTAVTGYLVRHAAQPDPPGLPTLRPFQRAQGEAALSWLRRRWATRPAV